MIEIAADTQKNIREYLANNPGKYLRLVVDGDGCAGPYFNLSLDEAAENEDIIRVNGIDILVSDQVKKLAAITTIRIFLNFSEFIFFLKFAAGEPVDPGWIIGQQVFRAFPKTQDKFPNLVYNYDQIWV
jgi:hypothetical protein